MAKYQIIYTSCKRGITGNTEGLQIYSHSQGIPGKLSDYVKGFLLYQAPGPLPGEQTNPQKMPRSFVYRQLPNKALGVVLKSYLDRDHSGQPGPNYISHGLVMDENELDCYPAELYGGGMWLGHMDVDEVNSPEVPQLLPETEIMKGQGVTVENVGEFLAANRMGVFKKMLAAMLAHKSTRKKIIICDVPDNILMWIAALHYALPLEMAHDVSFSTYEYDPARAQCQICGAVPSGTAYNPRGANFTFDFTQGFIPDIEAEDDFFDFIKDGLTGSYDDLVDFHKFTMNKLTSLGSDENYINVYALYRMLECGLDNLPLESFSAAIKVADGFGQQGLHTEAHEVILSNGAFVMSAEDDYALEIFKALVSNYKEAEASIQEKIRELITEKVNLAFQGESATKDSFLGFYAALKVICEPQGVYIPGELIENIETMVKNLGESQWRWDFIVELYCDYVLTQNIPVENLSLDHEMGRVVGDIVAARLKSDPNLGFVLVTRIIARFAHDWNYLANMSLNLEGVVLDAPDSEGLFDKHWTYVYDMFVAKQSHNRQNIFKLFLSLDRGDQVYEIYKVFMSRAGNVRTARELFFEQTAIKDRVFIKDYLLKIYEVYYDFLASQKESNAKRELVRLIADNDITVDFVSNLIDEILAEIPLGPLSRDNEKLVNTILDYLRGQGAGDLPERLVLFAIGMLLGKVGSSYEMENALGTIRRIAKADTIPSQGDSKFINWVASPMYSNSKTSEELIGNYELFAHSQDSTRSFIEAWAKESLKGKDKEYSSIFMFLGFLFKKGDAENRVEVGKVYCKLSKQKLEALNEAALEKYKGDMKYLLYWSEIYEVAVSTNSLLAGIGNLFRRKQ
ncbi:MAG: hypothetical protein FWC73_02080 [Defluviitaleaceae bacterium]|nr:hypothetical protein [Defluviitaleaceae bacterium]